MTVDLRLLALQGERPTMPLGEDEDPAGRAHTDVEALKDGATMMVQAGNRVAALALLWSAVAIDPVDLGAHRRLAAMLANAGDADGAANEYARYIDFVLPLGDVGRAAGELAYGAKMLGGRPALREAAEKIAVAIRGLVPADLAPAPALLPMPRLLPKVAFRFCVHDEGQNHWLQLEGGEPGVRPAAVRLLDWDDHVLDTRRCIALAPGQKGHMPPAEDEAPAVVWAVLRISDELLVALDVGSPAPYRLEALVDAEWLSTTLADTGCRSGRRVKSAALGVGAS